MSTAGKVLTVLILLVMVGWIIMLSAVTQLNVNWAQKVAAQTKTLDGAKQQLADANTKSLDLTEQARVVQATKDRDLRGFQGRIAATQARLSAKTEDLTHVQVQVADYEAAVQRAGTHLATRQAEKAKAESDLAAKRVELAKLQDENAQLRDQLGKLQEDFKRLLANNAKAVNKSASDRPVAQPTSGRTPPSS